MSRKSPKITALLLSLLFALTVAVGAAGADPVGDAVSDISEIYSYLDQADKTSINDAKNNASGLSDADSVWNSILAPDSLWTSEIQSKLNAAGYGKADLKDFIRSLASVQYSSDTSALNTELTNFKSQQAGLVAALLPGIAAQDLVNFYQDWKSNIPGAISLSDLNTVIQSGDYATISSRLNDWSVDALNAALDDWDGSPNADLKSKLQALGITSSDIISAKDTFGAAVDSQNEAEIALAKGYVRSEVVKLQGSTSMQAGDTSTFELSMFGINIPTDYLSWASGDSSIVEVSGNIMTAKAAGTVTVTASMGANWVYRADITVTSAGSDGGPSGGGPTGGDTGDPDEAADEAADTVNDSDATDDEVADSVDSAADSLSESVDSAETAEEAEQVADTASKLSDTLEQAADRVQDSDAAGIVGDAAAEVTSTLAKSAEKITSEEGKKEVQEAASKTMDAANKAMDKMDAAKATEVAEKIMESAGSLAKTLGDTAAEDISDKAAQIAQKAADKAGTDTLTATIAGEKTTAQVDTERLRQKAQAAAQAAAKMAEKMQESGLQSDKKLQTKVAVEVPPTGKKEVEVTLPAGTLEAMAESKVDAVEVKTEVATVSVPPNAFGEQAKGKEVSLTAGKVDRKDLPAGVQDRVPEGSTIVNLDAAVTGFTDSEGNTSKVSNFEQPVEVSIPYTLKEGEKPEEISVFYVKDDGEVVDLMEAGGWYDPASGTVKFRTNHFSEYLIKPARKSFADLSRFRWARETIEIMAGKGYIAGRTATHFDPGADITRAEFSALAVRIMALGTPENMELPFKDVAGDAWYRNAVATAYANDIVAGKAADVFDPKGKITRQEMAVIISRILTDEGYNPGQVSELDSFTDQGQIAGWARSGAALATREGIVSGLPGGKFAPRAKANRAQAAVMLYRMFQKL